jgi:hypothetical protein
LACWTWSSQVFCHFVIASNFLKLPGSHDRVIAVEIVMKISTTIWEQHTILNLLCLWHLIICLSRICHKQNWHKYDLDFLINYCHPFESELILLAECNGGIPNKLYLCFILSWMEQAPSVWPITGALLFGVVIWFGQDKFLRFSRAFHRRFRMLLSWVFSCLMTVCFASIRYGH